MGSGRLRGGARPGPGGSCALDEHSELEAGGTPLGTQVSAAGRRLVGRKGDPPVDRAAVRGAGPGQGQGAAVPWPGGGTQGTAGRIPGERTFQKKWLGPNAVTSN